MQASLLLTQRLRPLRFGFLTQGMDDLPAIRRWIRVTTCLWGGMYNPIIPVYRQRPNWWDDSKTGQQITHGYIEAFEPDFVVARDNDLLEEFRDRLTYPEARAISLDSLLQGSEAHVPFSYGTGVQHLYEHLYTTRFRFEQRDPAQFILPRPSTTGLTDLLRFVFGEFPRAGTLRQVRESYEFVFDAEVRDIGHDNLLSILTSRTSYPLVAGRQELSVNRPSRFPGLRLFVFDHTSAQDLVDYWNLRALGWEILPVPYRWIDAMTSQAEDLIEQVFRPHPETDNYWFHTGVVTSRSLGRETVRAEVERSWNVSDPRALNVTTHFPRIWDSWARPKDDARRCTVTAHQSYDTVSVDNNRITFESLALPLESTQQGAPGPRWAETIEVSPLLGAYEAATDFPPGLEDIADILRAIDWPGPWVSSEGIVQMKRFASANTWHIPTGAKVFRSWFENLGFDFEISSAGKLAREAIARLETIPRVDLLRNEATVRFFERLAHGLPEIEIDDLEELETLNRTRGRIESFHAVLGHFRRVCTSDRQADKCLRILT